MEKTQLNKISMKKNSPIFINLNNCLNENLTSKIEWDKIIAKGKELQNSFTLLVKTSFEIFRTSYFNVVY